MLSTPPLFKYRRYWLAVIIVLLAILDPFGLASSSDKASAQWLNRMFASHYPSLGQQRVAVVVLKKVRGSGQACVLVSSH